MSTKDEGKKEEYTENEKNTDTEQKKSKQASEIQAEAIEESGVPEEEKTGKPDTESGDTSEGIEEKLKKLEAENNELKESLLRKHADYENFRKRMFREKEEAIKYANSMLLLDIASIIDDFERAIKSADESQDFDAFHSGVVLIEKQLTSMLEKKWGLERFVSEGKEFNPEHHEAILSESRNNVDTPVVVEDFQSGYFLNGRVLRPAKVKIAQPETTDKNNSDN